MRASRGYAGAGWNRFIAILVRLVSNTGLEAVSLPQPPLRPYWMDSTRKKEAKASAGKTHVEVQVAVAVLVTTIPLQRLLAYDLALRLPQLWQLQKGIYSQSVPSGATDEMVTGQLGPAQVPSMLTPG